MCCGKGQTGKKCQCKKYCFTECVTIASTLINQDGDLIITLTDGTVHNAGNVTQPNGENPVIFSASPFFDGNSADQFGDNATFSTGNYVPINSCSFTLQASHIPKIGDYVEIKGKCVYKPNGNDASFVLGLKLGTLIPELPIFSGASSGSSNGYFYFTTTIKRISLNAPSISNSVLIIYSKIDINPAFSPSMVVNNPYNLVSELNELPLLITPSINQGADSNRFILEDYHITRYLRP